MREPYKFIFPSWVARRMKKIKQQTTLKISMISVGGILIGLFGLVIYNLFMSDMGLLPKSFLVFNLLCGLVLLSAFFDGSRKQYNSINQFERGYTNEEEERRSK